MGQDGKVPEDKDAEGEYSEEEGVERGKEENNDHRKRIERMKRDS